MDMHERRVSDQQTLKLINKVENLEHEIEKLREDFEVHLSAEGVKYLELKQSLQNIEVKISQILLEIQEPIESYKTAKYGVNFIKFIADTAKWLVPLVIGAAFAYGAINSYEGAVSEKSFIERKSER